MGKILVLAGIVLFLLGGFIFLGSKLGLGSLPLDFSFKKGNLKFYIPLGSSILISILLTILLRIFRK
ncbi:DUF2905 family protein [bacterium]|nr:DUF2905 family protein [bacterium]